MVKTGCLLLGIILHIFQSPVRYLFVSLVTFYILTLEGGQKQSDSNLK